MTRLAAWIGRYADGLVALLVAGVIALLTLIDIGVDIGPDELSAVTLLVLAVLAAALLRDRARQEGTNTQVMALLDASVPTLRELPGRLERLAELEKVVVGTRRALDEASMVRVVPGAEVRDLHAEARRDTDRWIYKGGTGTFLRAVTLPECVEDARRQRRTLLMRLEIIDPTNEEVCDHYARFRRSLVPGPDSTGEVWTVDRTRKESFATVLAACWHRQRFGLLDIDIGLSSIMSTFRWDVSSRRVIITQEDPHAPAIIVERDKPYYSRYTAELLTSLEQARRIPIEQARAVSLSDEPTVDEVQRLFARLGLSLPHSFSQAAVTDIIRKALRAKDPYAP